MATSASLTSTSKPYAVQSLLCCGVSGHPAGRGLRCPRNSQFPRFHDILCLYWPVCPYLDTTNHSCEERCSASHHVSTTREDRAMLSLNWVHQRFPPDMLTKLVLCVRRDFKFQDTKRFDDFMFSVCYLAVFSSLVSLVPDQYIQLQSII